MTQLEFDPRIDLIFTRQNFEIRLAFNIWLVFSLKTSSLEIKNFFIHEQKIGYVQEGKEPICFKCSYNPWRLLDVSASELYLELLHASSSFQKAALFPSVAWWDYNMILTAEK